MGNKNAQGRISARRAATFLASLGVLVMSSGAALMVTAGSANATGKGEHVEVGICHATSSDTNPYVFITVDDDSAKLKGHLMHRDSPNKHWKSAGTYVLGGAHVAGDPKRDYIASYPGHELDGNITAASCPAGGDEEVPPAWADVEFNDPTCAAPDSGSIDTSGSEGVTFEIAPDQASYSIGDSVTVDATAPDESSFAKDADTHWVHTFEASDAPCGEVSAPITASVSFTEPTCTATVGFTGTNTDKVSYAVTSGSVAPGADVVVTATAKGDNKLTGQTTFPHKFAAVPANCTTVSTPQVESSVVVSPPKAKTPKAKAHASAATVTPTVVEAGLSTSAPDLRGEQGLALMCAGMVMLLAAGGLGLRVRGVAARI